MGRYLLRRLLQLVPVFIGTTFLIYWLVWSVPGDPFAGKCGERRCPDQYIAFMTEKYHLDQNVFVQYFSYMKNLLQGDFGQTFSQREISDIIATAYPNTLKLALVALAIEAVIGLGAGVLTGLRRNGFLDNLVLVSTLFLIALPVFVVGFVLQWLLGVQWGIIRAEADGSSVPVRASGGPAASAVGDRGAAGSLPLTAGCSAFGRIGPPLCSITSVIIGYLSHCGARCPGTRDGKSPGLQEPGAFVGLNRSGATYGSRTPGAVVKVVARSDHAVEYAHADAGCASIPR
ncbi:ABC transporter permease [Micromonospora zamorensis]|uniref:ABC transporter permease n=1 Tax=Micromonospora zamorensis TaxID=709883 RepID=UPI00378D9DB9